MSDLLLALSTDDRQGHVLAGTIYNFDPTTYQKTSTPWTYNDHNVTLNKTITLVPNGEEELNVGNDENGYCQGFKTVKWFLVDADYKNERNQSNDVPILRYADVLLMKAEAITRTPRPPTVLRRSRCSIRSALMSMRPASTTNRRCRRSTTSADVSSSLRTGSRNDMIRFGHFEDEYGFHKKSFANAKFDKFRRVFPIPTSKLNTSGWSQNPGYSK